MLLASLLNCKLTQVTQYVRNQQHVALCDRATGEHGSSHVLLLSAFRLRHTLSSSYEGQRVCHQYRWY